MAPRETPKATPKMQRTVPKTNTVTKKQLLAAPGSVSTIKKTMSSRKITENTSIKVPDTPRELRQRTNTVPKVSTPKPKENKSVPLPGSVTKSAKKSWKRRPKPAHSGVPVPEKMKKILERQLQDLECSL